jgi:phage gp46-like protein
VIDYAMNGLLLADDDGLATAVIISLWTDRQANADDALPAGSDRRGWWGDELSSPLGDKIGSRLWLNDNAKQLASVLVQDRAYAIEALQWLIDDGVASAVDVVASNPRAGVRALDIAISRPGRAVARYQFSRFWND